jgi:hypothetical protein
MGGVDLVVLKVTPCTSDSAGVMRGQVRRWRLTTVKGIEVTVGKPLKITASVLNWVSHLACLKG